LGAIDEANLVALAAIDQALPARLDHWAGDWDAWLSAGGPHQAELGHAAKLHAAHFGPLPDAGDARRFATLVAGLHVR
jgi:hypothetical protein